MPLYLDVHNRIDGLTTEMAAEAHKKDLAVQGKHGVNYIRYWYDEAPARCSVWSKPRARKRPWPSTARPTAPWLTRSSK